jgi:hypothetical protein
MITINLAFDEEIAKELKDYFTNLGIDSKLKKFEVQVNKMDFDEKILDTFLKKTKRTQHLIQKINSNSYLISKLANVEDLGLGTCEICGLVSTEDKLFSHRWTHGA